MKRVKQIVTIFTTILLLQIGANTAYAGTDITITCDSASCTANSPNPLFDSDGLIPGQSISQNLTAINNHSESCLLTVSAKNKSFFEQEISVDLSQKLFSVIKTNSTDVFGTSSGENATSDRTLYDVLNTPNISLGEINSGSSKIYKWILTLDSAVGNEYQGKETQFDFDAIFTCEDALNIGGNGSDESNDEEDEDDDENSDDENDENDNDDESSEGGTLGGSTEAGGLFITPYLIQGEGETEPLGEDSQVDAQVEGAQTEETPEVLGTKDQECKDPWWWPLVFLLQIIISYITYKSSINTHKEFSEPQEQLVLDPEIRQSEYTKETYSKYYTSMLTVSAIFAFIFFIFFCPKWDTIVSLLIGAGFMFVLFMKLNEKQDLDNSRVIH